MHIHNMFNNTLLLFTNMFRSLSVTQLSDALMQYTQGTYWHVARKRIKQILKM